MRILHVYDMASVARTLADAQTGLGHPATVMARATPVTEPPDVVLPATTNSVLSQLAILRHRREVRSADVIHVHGGIWVSHLIWSFLRARFPRKAIVVHLHGSETRTRKGLHHLRSADRLLCTSPDLLRRVPGASWLPAPVVLPAATTAPPGGKPLFGHFPTNRAIKGTDRLVDGFLRLGPADRTSPEPGVTRYEGRDATLLVVEGLPHRRALEIMERCGAVLDQVNDLGIYSVVSVEAMARGRVALSSYDPSLYPDALPVIRLTMDTIPSVLQGLLDQRDAWASTGAAGRAYAERTHDARAVARKTLGIYEEALARRRGPRSELTGPRDSPGS